MENASERYLAKAERILGRGDEMASMAFIGGVIVGVVLCCVVVVGCSDDEPSQDSTDRENEGG